MELEDSFGQYSENNHGNLEETKWLFDSGIQ